MRIVTIKNPVPLESPFTIVSTDYTSGTSLLVEDSSSFVDDGLILVGGLGNEKSETTDLTATPPSASSLTITAMSYPHSSDESVQTVLWNQYCVQYKTDSDGTWTDLTTGTNFDWSTNDTIYQHGDGESNYYYRVRYYNTATNKYSDWSEQVSGVGLTRSTVGSMIEEVRKNTKDESTQKASDKTIIGYFNYAQDVVKSMYKKWPWLQEEATIVPATLALPSDFKRAYRLKYNYVSGSDSQTYYLKYLPPVDFQEKYSDNNASTSDYLVDYTIDDINNVVKLGPSPTTATAILTLVYEKDITDLEEYTDTTVIPLPELLITYATAKVWKLKSNPDEYNSWMQNFSDLLQVLDQARPVSYHPRTLKRYMGRDYNTHKAVYSEDYI
jgi:hypothetical protein